MKWYLLKSNKCPKCTSYLTGTDSLLTCSKPECDFKISGDKFKELSNIYSEKYRSHDRFNDGEGWSKFQDDDKEEEEDYFEI